MTAKQGFVQRRLDLATLHLDLPKGAERWTAEHRGHADAARLVPELSRLAREHRSAETSMPVAAAPGTNQEQRPPVS